MTSVEVIIPVHTQTRPIARAVHSVIDEGVPGAHVTVVCHNVGMDVISAQLRDLASNERVTLVEFRDGERSAAGPRNHAISQSRADYLCFLDSDDELDRGALTAWTKELAAAPDLLIGQMSSEVSGRIMAPAPRIARFEGLHPVQDLLNYRTAPVGVLARRELVASGDSPLYRQGFRTGEDVALGLFLWNRAQTIRYSRHSAGYNIRVDSGDRLTTEPVPIAEVLAPIDEAIRLPWLQTASRRQKQAIAVKLLRHQVIYMLRGVRERSPVSAEDLQAAASTVRALCDFVPGVVGYFPFMEARMIRAVRDQDLSAFESADRSLSKIHYSRKLITVNPFRSFAPESPYVRSRRTRFGPNHLNS